MVMVLQLILVCTKSQIMSTPLETSKYRQLVSCWTFHTEDMVWNQVQTVRMLYNVSTAVDMV